VSRREHPRARARKANRPRAIAAYVARKGPLSFEALVTEFERRGYHPLTFCRAFADGCDERLIEADAGWTVRARS